MSNAAQGANKGANKSSVLKKIALVLLALVLLLIVVVLWLLYSSAGARFVLSYAPENLSVESVSGRLAGPLILNGVKFETPGQRVSVKSVETSVQLWPLLQPKILIDSLKLQGLTVQLRPVPAAPAQSSAPLELPEIVLRNLAVSDVLIQSQEGAAEPITLAQFSDIHSAHLRLLGQHLEVRALALSERRGEAKIDGLVNLQNDGLKTSNTLNFDLKAAQSALTLKGNLQGNAQLLRLDAALSAYATVVQPGATTASAPMPILLSATVSDVLSQDLSWTLKLQGEALDLAELRASVQALNAQATANATVAAEQAEITGGPKRADLDLSAHGTLSKGDVSGRVVLDGAVFGLEQLSAHWSDPVLLQLLGLKLNLPDGGKLSAQGTLPRAALSADASGDLPDSSLSAQWQELTLPTTLGWPAGLSSERGSVEVKADSERLVAQFDVALKRVLEAQNLSANVQGELVKQGPQLAVSPLKIRLDDGGELDSELRLTLPSEQSSALSWELTLAAKALNPALFAEQWPGAVALELSSKGLWQNEQLTAEVEFPTLKGELRGQPLTGNGTLQFERSFNPTGKVQLRWGVNSAQFFATEAGTVRSSLDIPQLAELAPGSSGSIQGELSLKHDEQLSLEANLQARLLRVAGLSVEALDLNAQLSDQLQAPITLKLDANAIVYGKQQLKHAKLSLSGTRAAHRLDAELAHELASLSVSTQGALLEQDQRFSWQGMLDKLQIRPTARPRAGRRANVEQTSEISDGELDDEEQSEPELPIEAGEYTLQKPAALKLSAEQITLTDACLVGPGLNSCLQLDYLPAGESLVNLQLEQLDLGRVMAQMPRDGRAPVRLRGGIKGQMRMALNAGVLSELVGEFRTAGDAPIRVVIPRELSAPLRLTVEQFQISAQSEAGVALINGAVKITDAGNVEIRQLRIGPELLAGEVAIDFGSLSAFAGASDTLINPSGAIRGQVTLSGTPDLPQYQGTIRLENAAVEIPSAGLKINNANASLVSDGPRLNLQASMDSGGGKLTATGWLAPTESQLAEIDLAGDRVLFADIPSAKVVASPKLKIAHEGERIKITGTVEIVSANLRLDRFESSVTRSPDVVVTDDPKVAPSTPIYADVRVDLGSDVALRGFGLNGKVSGRLSVRERPKRASTARGEIAVTGTYKAYGQDLTIERGKLLFSSSPLDDPGLDIRAVRKIDAVKAGVQVRGTALRPELTVWSDPVLEQSDALSYVVLGRPLRGASGSESALVGKAANALGTAGGNFLAKGLGQKVGLELGVETLSDIGGPAFTAGKYLSPSLYVGYGQGLFNPQTLFILRYKLYDNYEVEALSGREQKIGVNYRKEK